MHLNDDVMTFQQFGLSSCLEHLPAASTPNDRCEKRKQESRAPDRARQLGSSGGVLHNREKGERKEGKRGEREKGIQDVSAHVIGWRAHTHS